MSAFVPFECVFVRMYGLATSSELTRDSQKLTKILGGSFNPNLKFKGTEYSCGAHTMPETKTCSPGIIVSLDPKVHDADSVLPGNGIHISLIEYLNSRANVNQTRIPSAVPWESFMKTKSS